MILNNLNILHEHFSNIAKTVTLREKKISLDKALKCMVGPTSCSIPWTVKRELRWLWIPMFSTHTNELDYWIVCLYTVFLEYAE